MNGTRKQWVNDDNYKVLFNLDSDSVCVVNPLDQNSSGKTNVDEGSQFQHSGVKLTGEQLSIGFVFRTVNTQNVYDCKDDTMIIYPAQSSKDIVLDYDMIVVIHS